MIVSGILWLLVWPLVIVLSYYLIRWALKKYENKLEKSDD